jgi:polyhydroxybutyrate depolymerase
MRKKSELSRLMCRFGVGVLMGFCCTVNAATDLGDFTGSPQDTWDGLRALGIEVRNFHQPNLLNPEEKILRRYLQYVPRSIHRHRHHNQAYPLVIMLPGAGLSAELGREWDWGNRVEQLADKEQFMVVYANSHAPAGDLETQNPGNPFYMNGGYWRTCFGKPGTGPEFFTVDDVAYLRKVIARVQAEGLPVDKNRIYLMGMSNGGEMVQRAAREMPELLAGAGVVMPVNSMPATVPFFTCTQRPQHPVSMMFIYSPKDTLLDTIYSSMGFDYGAVMKDSVSQWRDALTINAASEKVKLLPNKVNEGAGYTGNVPWALASLNSSITRYDYRKAPAGNDYAVLEINPAAGHAWPNSGDTDASVAEAPYNGFKNQDINAEEVLWRFLKKSRRIAQ